MTNLESFLLDVYLGELLSPGFRNDCTVYYDRQDRHFGCCDSVLVTVKSRYDHENHVKIHADLDCGSGYAQRNRLTFFFEPVPWILEGR